MRGHCRTFRVGPDFVNEVMRTNTAEELATKYRNAIAGLIVAAEDHLAEFDGEKVREQVTRWLERAIENSALTELPISGMVN